MHAFPPIFVHIKSNPEEQHKCGPNCSTILHDIVSYDTQCKIRLLAGWRPLQREAQYGGPRGRKCTQECSLEVVKASG